MLVCLARSDQGDLYVAMSPIIYPKIWATQEVRFPRAMQERMGMTGRRHRPEFNAKVALEARLGERTINELAAEYGVPPVQLPQGKKVVL
jgi:hypothetical protein